MTITLLLLLSAGLLVISYFLWTLHSRLRLLERTSSTLKKTGKGYSQDAR